MPRKATNWIVIHCSATRPSQDVGAADITKWHKARGFRTIGYHYVIKRDGKLQTGRPVGDIGAHVEGHNSDSVGVCMVGGLNEETWKPESNFTPAQWATLDQIVGVLVEKYPKAKVLGHRDFKGVRKECPCFAAKTWAKMNGFPT